MVYFCTKITVFLLVMKIELTLSILDHIGVLFFAISGMLTAAQRNLDFLGGFIIAFITALGGGTVRDLLLNVDVEWMSSLSHLLTVLVGGAIGLFFRKRLKHLRKTFFFFDTMGISLFTVLGVQKGLAYDQIPLTSMFLGMISATFGGVIRDVLCNEIPLIFRKEIYAIPCLTGAGIYLLGSYFELLNPMLTLLISSSIIFTFRSLAVYFKWKIPLISEVN